MVAKRLAVTALVAFAVAPSCRRARFHVARRAPAPVPLAPAAPVTPAVPLAQPAGTQVMLPSGRSIADVAAQVTPSVVNVFSEHRVRRPVDDPFMQMFGGARPRHALSLGSGVIIGSDGLIVTNNHVIAQAEKIRVALKDGRELEAHLVGTDPRSDVAVLRVDARNLPAIQIADATKIRVGDLVLAVGDPYGIGQTVTMGIISATGRTNLGITDVEDFIQTDAAINPGNSGGALVDMQGKLIGLNTAIVSGSGGYQGIGFAIPSNIVVQVAQQLERNGKVTRGWLGIAIADVTGDLAAALHRPPHSGAVVTLVAPDSPASRAGLQKGDVITALDGVAVLDAGHLRNLIALAGPKRVHLDFVRDGKPMEADATLSEAPSEPDTGNGE